MALVLKDRVKGWTDSYGEDNFVIFATTNGYQSFSVIGNGNQTYYTVFDPTNYDWEVGIGTYTAATTTLSRDTILSSSNNNLIVSFLPGTKELFVGYPAEKAVTLDTPQTLTDKTLVNATVTSGTINNTSIGATTPASGAFTTLVASGASLTSVNAGVALLTSATVTTLNATGASIASANIGNLQFTAASIASINAGVAVITNLSATSASIASMNAGVALLTTATVTTLNATGASIASANIGNLQFTAASIASINAGVAVITNLTATGASIASANVGNAVITAATVTGASIASANVGTAVITTGTVTNLTSTSASVASINAAVALITTGTVTALTATGASVASANVGTAVVTGLTATGASIASVNAGVAVLAAGTAALPSLTTTGDTNTGIFFPAADTVGFSTGGSERMRLDTSGNLGIGTTPSYRLHVAATAPTNSILAYLTNSQGGSTRSRVALQDASTTFAPDLGSVGNNITFDTVGAERMRIDSSGNVGIGTASPAVKLDLGSDLTAQKLFVFASGLSRAGFGVQSGDFRMFTPSDAAMTFGSMSTATGTTYTERMRIDSSGNVGIGGTADGYAKVQVLGTLPTSLQTSIGFRQTGTVPSGTTSTAYGYNNNLLTQAASFTLSNYYHFFTYQNTIGAGSSITNQYGYFVDATLTGATNNYGFYSNIASGSNRWNFYAAGTAVNYFAGEVRNGRTTNLYGETLSVAGFAVIGANSGGTGQVIIGNDGTTGINGTVDNVAYVTRTNNTERMRVTAGGNVGIGRTAYTSITTNGAWLEPGTNGLYHFGCDTVNGVLYVNQNGSGQVVSFNKSGTELFSVRNNGEVIVGTTDQGAYNLQCNGTGVWGAGAYVNGSDARLKDNIQSLDSGLDVVKAMRPVTFQYKPEYSKDQSVQPGFIAQELQTAMAGKPYLEGVVQEGTNHLNVAYQNIIPILVKAIQELEAKVAALEAK